MMVANRACEAVIAPWEQNPYRLVSLREIVMTYAEDEVHFVPLGNLFFLLGGVDAPASVGPKTVLQLSALVEACIPEMERLGLRVSAVHAKLLMQMLDGTHPVINIHDQITGLRTSLGVELDQTLFLHVKYEDGRFYRDPLDGVSNDVHDNFSSVLEDCREAARCYALGRYNASVFHSMRVLEIGLIALGSNLNVPAAANKNWHELLKQIEKAVDEIGPSSDPDWRANRQWYSDAATQFRYVKDAWRNDIMHVHQPYTQRRAQEVLMATRSFMCQIATRLQESP
jgi:HEPN domain-containing protein